MSRIDTKRVTLEIGCWSISLVASLVMTIVSRRRCDGQGARQSIINDCTSRCALAETTKYDICDKIIMIRATIQLMFFVHPVKRKCYHKLFRNFRNCNIVTFYRSAADVSDYHTLKSLELSLIWMGNTLWIRPGDHSSGCSSRTLADLEHGELPWASTEGAPTFLQAAVFRGLRTLTTESRTALSASLWHLWQCLAFSDDSPWV